MHGYDTSLSDNQIAILISGYLISYRKLFLFELVGLRTLSFTKLSLQNDKEVIGYCGKQLCSLVKLQNFLIPQDKTTTF